MKSLDNIALFAREYSCMEIVCLLFSVLHFHKCICINVIYERKKCFRRKYYHYCMNYFSNTFTVCE